MPIRKAAFLKVTISLTGIVIVGVTWIGRTGSRERRDIPVSIFPDQLLTRQQSLMRGIRECVSHPQNVSISRRQLLRATSKKQSAQGRYPSHDHTAAGYQLASFHIFPVKVIPRIWFLNPDAMIINTCTSRNRIRIANAKKWIVRADWNPPNMPDRNGKAALIAGDIA